MNTKLPFSVYRDPEDLDWCVRSNLPTFYYKRRWPDLPAAERCARDLNDAFGEGYEQHRREVRQALGV